MPQHTIQFSFLGQKLRWLIFCKARNHIQFIFQEAVALFLLEFASCLGEILPRSTCSYLWRSLLSLIKLRLYRDHSQNWPRQVFRIHDSALAHSSINAPHLSASLSKALTTLIFWYGQGCTLDIKSLNLYQKKIKGLFEARYPGLNHFKASYSYSPG